MTTIEERGAYLNNPFNSKPLFGDYSSFYITIAVCTVLFTFLVAINVILGCCSRHKYYWQDRHTGNRWLVSIWSATPHKQPPLDFTELQDVVSFQKAPLEQTEYVVSPPRPDEPRGFGRLAHLHHQQQHQQQHHSQVKDHKLAKMVFLVMYPAVALLAMFIVGVIIILLRFGPVICGVRHHALPDIKEWEEDKAYDQRVSYA